ncbi:hypothetical protein Hanom_Chr12g01146591 [Helianthus anomalus]
MSPPLFAGRRLRRVGEPPAARHHHHRLQHQQVTIIIIFLEQKRRINQSLISDPSVNDTDHRTIEPTAGFCRRPLDRRFSPLSLSPIALSLPVPSSYHHHDGGGGRPTPRSKEGRRWVFEVCESVRARTADAGGI